ncbi:MAG: exodeoxyribonuclease V subunit beta [Methylococcaceae bacterium]
MKINCFDALNTPLVNGVNLIEASAGTGKTYTLAMLVLRFVVEQNLPIEKILVVTFTKAATEELKERVRLRLADAKRALKHIPPSPPSKGGDNTLSNWLDALPIENSEIERRLQIALLSIDQASIFTIHSFCQKVLREHALESGQLFNAELTDDLAQITQCCADDFWRKNIYERSAWEASILTANYKMPDELLKSVDRIGHHVTIYPIEIKNIDALLIELKILFDAAKTNFNDFRETLENDLDKFTKESKAAKHFVMLNAWLNGESSQIDKKAFDFLTTTGIYDSLKKAVLKKQPTFADDLGINTTLFDDLKTTFDQCGLMLRRELAETLRREIDQRLLERNALTFDHLIIRLDEALRGENKPEQLVEELRARFSVALIDEFQDTDDSQWFIFKTLFAAESQYLYLIGDPKQAIYKFRGADIYSYLDAKHSANASFTLAQNWRSHPNLVQAVNHTFKRDNAFLIEELEFNAVSAANSHEKGAIYFEENPLPPLMLWHALPNSGDSWTAYKGGANNNVEKCFCFAVVEEILKLLQDDYSLQPQNRRLKPKDIAILVRKNKQAKAFQTALRDAGIPSVLNSTESIFTTPEATDLHTLLNALVNPTDIEALKHALTLNWFASIPHGQAFYKLMNDENALDSWLAKCLNYHEQWQKVGLMAMMHTFLAAEKVTPQLAKNHLAERQLTNIHHLLELLQQAALDEHLSPQKTLDWLRIAITNAVAKKTSTNDAQQLRLESDEDAVSIVTMHRAKGLEYPIVFCMSLWMPSELWHDDRAECHIDGKMCVDLGSVDFEQHRKLALDEQRAEDCRMFYVAVTRAKYRCYLAWADVRTKDKPNNSAFAHLFEFENSDAASQQNTFLDLKRTLPQCFDYQCLFEGEKPDGHYSPEIKTEILHHHTRHRDLRFSPWQMSSYTALSALSRTFTPDLPEDKAREPFENAPPIVLDLPRGSHTGNVVHYLLETFNFADLANGIDISTARDKACLRYGLKVAHPEILNKLLQNVVQKPLSNDANFCLMNLSESDYVKEMPFYLTTQKINTDAINRILADEPTYQTLDSKTINGYLTGFIDLICVYENRYYVMDYKTNYLPDYQPETLLQSMREHNYGLQYWLYSVVLHRYLESRLKDYDIEKHFGGVRYLFVRGMQPEFPLNGIFETQPSSAKLIALANLFKGV